MERITDMNPKIFIIVLNWNSHQDTIECIISLSKIEYPNYEILLVDNGSTDGSEQILRERFPHITVMQTGENLGFTGGNNTGIRHALKNGAEYVVLLNNDTVVDPQFITALVTVAVQDTAAGMLCSKIYFYDRPNIIWYAGASFYSWLGWGRHRGYGEQDRGQYDRTEETDRPTGCALMVSKALCDSVGLLRDYFFCYVEDLDWGMRANKLHLKVVYVPGSKVWHKVSRSTGGSSSGLSHYYIIRNMLSCLDANEPLPLPLRTLRQLTVFCAMFLSLFTQNVPIIRGSYYLYRGMVDYFHGVFGKWRYD